jgi:hypothetical protein
MFAVDVGGFGSVPAICSIKNPFASFDERTMLGELALKTAHVLNIVTRMTKNTKTTSVFFETSVCLTGTETPLFVNHNHHFLFKNISFPSRHSYNYVRTQGL